MFRWPGLFRTVRFKLTVWYSSLLLVFGLAFVIALNVAVRLDSPDPFLEFEGYPLERLELRILPAPGNAFEGARPMALGTLAEQAGAQASSDSQDRLRLWSLFALLGLALTSGVGGYSLSGMLLRPVRDITEVASEISASSLNRRIDHEGPDDELKALADTFDSMIERIQSGFESQRRFVQDAAHELRTPLAAIRTNIEVLELDGEASVEEHRELLETVMTQNARLARLSEDLLLLTTSDGEPLGLETVDATAVANQVSAELSPIAEQRGITVCVQSPEPLLVMGITDFLHRCVSNLVDNAIKYSEDGATVTTTVAQVDGLATISVSDNGPGIAPEDLGHVFDRFYRVDKGRSRRLGGAGLGLSIVKELAEAMKGSVTVDSRSGVGSSFTLKLALDDSP
jgi:signal transduction histidine kinase